MKMESMPMAEVGQLTRGVDTGQQISTKTPLPGHSRVADQRSRETDHSMKPGSLPKTDSRRVKLVMTGNDLKPEIRNSPLDDHWNETCAVITDVPGECDGTFSHNISYLSTSPSPDTKSKTLPRTIPNIYRRYAASLAAASVSVTSFLSPIVMICLPLGTGRNHETPVACDPDCEIQLISLSFKLLILLIGTWALFARRPQASVPRLSVFLSLVLFTVALLTLSYWLFYGVRILRPGIRDYKVIVGFASSLVDSLLFVHYLAVVLLRIRPTVGGQFVVKIVRSPDGESRSYSVGPMSIQSLAVCCLQHYCRDFPVYSPSLHQIRGGREMQRSSSSASAAEYKLYSVDDTPSPLDLASPDAAGADAAADSREPPKGPSASSSSCLSQRRRVNEEELREWQRKLDRRRLRLISATEEAFSRVTKVEPTAEGKQAGYATVQEASEAVFAGLSRPLYRYLRSIHRHLPYSKQSVLDHLTICISHDMSARSFLERYLQEAPVGLVPSGTGGLEEEEEGQSEWILVGDRLLNSAVENSTTFELRKDAVRLLVSVREIPYLCLTQDSSDVKTAAFVLESYGQSTRERNL